MKHIKIPSRLNLEEWKPGEVKTYVQLRRYTKDGTVPLSVSVDALAERIGITDITLRKHMKMFESIKAIKRQAVGKTNNNIRKLWVVK